MAERGPGAPVTVAPAALAVALAGALQRAGLAVTPVQTSRFADALRLVVPWRRDQLYWTARIALVTGHSQLTLFDAVFAAVFDGMLDPADRRGDTTGPPPVGAEPSRGPATDRRRAEPGEVDHGAGGTPTVTSGGGQDDGEQPVDGLVPVVASAEERLRDTAFAELAEDEVAEMRRLVRRIALATPPRRARRTRPTPRSAERVDMRRTLRRSLRSGGEPIRLVHRTRRRQRRRLVMLCDVSGSMEPYTRVYLTLLQGAVSGARAEAFVFSTRLTRLTRQLAGRDPDLALSMAAVTAPDWAGGTRIAESLRCFIDTHGRRGLARGAVVVILSDGWDHGDPRDTALQMARLRRLAHRIVWINPRSAARGYAPSTGGMAAALPHCDAFVSGHTLAALDVVAAAIGAHRGRQNPNRRNPDAA